MEKGVPVRSISRCLAMLQFINRNGPSSLMDIARAVDLPYPTTIRIVQTLMHEGMLESEPIRKLYRATSLVQTLSVGVHEQGHLLQVARPHLVALTRKHGWPVNITTPVGPHMIVRDSTYAMTSRAFSTYYPGFPFPMLECGAGYAHLAFSDDEARTCLLAGLEAAGCNKVAIEMFRSGNLTRRIRSDGYATHHRTLSTMNPGKTSAIAVPIMGAGYVAGVLSLSYFDSSMSMAEAIRLYVDEMRTRANEITLSLAELAGKSHAAAAPGLPQPAAPKPAAPAGARQRTVAQAAGKAPVRRQRKSVAVM